MRCQFCQQEIGVSAAVCDWCGRRQEAPPPPQEDDLPPGPRTLTPPPPPPEPSPSQELRASLRWREIRDFLKADPLLLAVFVLLGLNALRASAEMISGGGLLGNLLDVAIFVGIISFRYWAWLLAIFGQGVAILILAVVLILSFRVSEAAPLLVILLSFRFLVAVFIFSALLARRDRFD